MSHFADERHSFGTPVEFSEQDLPLLVLAGVDELKPVKDGATGATLPLVRPDKGLKPAPLPKLGNDAVPLEVLSAKPLKALKAPPLSPCVTDNKAHMWSTIKHDTQCMLGDVRGVTSAPAVRRLAFLMARFFITSWLARENIPAWRRINNLRGIYTTLVVLEVWKPKFTTRLQCVGFLPPLLHLPDPSFCPSTPYQQSA